jgi:hypothetical protein
VLAQFGVVLGDLGQVGVVDLPQFRAVQHRMQVGDLAPGPGQALVGVFHGGDEGLPGGRRGGAAQGFHQGAVLAQQLIHGGRDVFGFDFAVAGQAGEIEQRVHGGGGFH